MRFNSKGICYLIGRKLLLSLALKRIGQKQTFPRNINFGAFRGDSRYLLQIKREFEKV